MSQSPVHDYLFYMREVLGVSSVLLPATAETVREALPELFETRSSHWPPPSEMDLLILVESEVARELWTGEGEELWERMKGAMKLGSRRVLELQASGALSERALADLLAAYPAASVLILRPVPERSPREERFVSTARVVESFAPSTLVARPELKREAWNDLQTVMRHLGISTAPQTKN